MVVKHNIELFNWCGEKQVNEALAKFGYQHRQTISDDLTTVMSKLLSEGINVMVLHSNKEGFDYVLALDTRAFQQR